MQPYYDDGNGIQIYLGDCRDVLPTIKAGTVDVVLADPNYVETSLDWDVKTDGWPDLVEPLLSSSGSMWCFGSLRYFLVNVAAFSDHWRYAQEIIWEKHNGSGLQADRFRRVHEHLTHWYPKRNRWSDLYKSPQFTMDATPRTVRRKSLPPQHQGARGPSVYESVDGGPRHMRSVQLVRSCHGYALHETQKPEGIVRPALAFSTPPGGLIVDPFMGSGTTLAVAKQMGCRAIGIEEHEIDCENAANRLAQSVMALGA